MSIATTTGDTGQTSLVGGQRVSKGHVRVEAYGTVDELVAAIGLARAVCEHEEAKTLAKRIQRDLFGVSESLASDQSPAGAFDAARVDDITHHIHRIERLDGILIDWAVPGDHIAGAAFDVARTVCRRAERAIVRLWDNGEAMHPIVLVYLNRLADLLWLLGRLVERDAGITAALRTHDEPGRRWSKAWP